MRNARNFHFVVEEDSKIIGRFERLKDACHVAAIRGWRNERLQVSLIRVESGLNTSKFRLQSQGAKTASGRRRNLQVERAVLHRSSTSAHSQ